MPFKTLRANLLVQAFIREADSKDLRCFVIDGRWWHRFSARRARRVSRQYSPGGTPVLVVKITPDERAPAIKAARTPGLKVAGVDIIRSRNAPLLLEVNSSTGLAGIETATGKDIAGMMIASIEKKPG